MDQKHLRIMELLEKRLEEYHNAELGASEPGGVPVGSYVRNIRFSISEVNWMVGQVEMLAIRAGTTSDKPVYSSESDKVEWNQKQ